MKPYQPSPKIPPAGLLKMSTVFLLGSSATGGLFYLISLFFYLALLFPLGMGLVGGFLSGWAVQSGKVRHPLAASLCGLLTGFSIYGTFQGLGYWGIIQQATQTIRQSDPSISAAEAAQVVQADLQQSTGLSGFPGYLKMESQKGINIARIGPAGISIEKTSSWLYWLIELAIIQYLTITKARTLAQRAFCEEADDWYDEPLRCGNVEPEAKARFLEAIEAQRWATAGSCIDSQIEEVVVGSLEVYTQTVIDADDHPTSPDHYAKVCIIYDTAAGKDGRLILHPINTGLLTPSDYAALHRAIPSTAAHLGDDAAIVYQEHDLSAEKIAAILEQLKRYPAIQAAYLLQIIEIGDSSLLETYQLGIIFDRQYITSDQDKSLLLHELSSELDTPGEAYVTLLNDDPTSLQAIRQVVSQPIYHKQIR